ncbi:hypothetical protein V8E36_001672 [Tilletia maclaganii]
MGSKGKRVGGAAASELARVAVELDAKPASQGRNETEDGVEQGRQGRGEAEQERLNPTHERGERRLQRTEELVDRVELEVGNHLAHEGAHDGEHLVQIGHQAVDGAHKVGRLGRGELLLADLGLGEELLEGRVVGLELRARALEDGDGLGLDGGLGGGSASLLDEVKVTGVQVESEAIEQAVDGAEEGINETRAEVVTENVEDLVQTRADGPETRGDLLDDDRDRVEVEAVYIAFPHREARSR